jgi:hypothetical protein
VSDLRALPIVVGGCHRSGTSLIRRILDAHPRIHCGPELTFFRDFYGEYRDDPLAHLRFARTARDYVSEDDALGILGGAFVELHEQAARRAGKERWADKTPENVLHLDGWERLLGGRFVFVHVVRNPLDTLASMADRFPLTLPPDLEGRIGHYLACTEAGIGFAGRHPQRSVRVVYEQLCADPAGSVEELMRGLGEEAHPSQLAFNELPHDEGVEDPGIAATDGVHGESVGRWRTVLSAEEAEHAWARTQAAWSAVDPEHRHAPTLVRGS